MDSGNPILRFELGVGGARREWAKTLSDSVFLFLFSRLGKSGDGVERDKSEERV